MVLLERFQWDYENKCKSRTKCWPLNCGTTWTGIKIRWDSRYCVSKTIFTLTGLYNNKYAQAIPHLLFYCIFWLSVSIYVLLYCANMMGTDMMLPPPPHTHPPKSPHTLPLIFPLICLPCQSEPPRAPLWKHPSSLFRRTNNFFLLWPLDTRTGPHLAPHAHTRIRGARDKQREI